MNYWDFFTVIWASPILAMAGTIILIVLLLIILVAAIAGGIDVIENGENPLIAIACWIFAAIVVTFGAPLIVMLVTEINKHL